MSLALLLALACCPAGGAQRPAASTAPPPDLVILRGTHDRIELRRDMVRLAVGDPDVAVVHEVDTRQLLVLGRSVGRTSIVVWYAGGGHEELRVSVERDLSVLRSALRDIHPSIEAEVAPDGDAIVLRGLVPDVSYSRSAEAAAQGYLQAVAARRAGPGTSGPLVLGRDERPAVVRGGAIGADPGAVRVPEGTAAAPVAVIDLIRLERLPPLAEDKVQEAVEAVGGASVRVRRIVRGQLPDDEQDILLLEGTVPHQVALTRVLTVAARTFLGESAGVEDIEVIADEAGALTQVRGAGRSSSGGDGTALAALGGFAGLGTGSGSSAGTRLGRALFNRIENSLGRAKLISVGKGRILSVIEVEDLPQVRVDIRLYELNRTRIRAQGSELAALVSDFDQPALLPATAARSVQGAGAARVGGGGTDVQNVLSFLDGGFANQLQLGTARFALDAVFSALESRNLARRLAQPSLTVLSGELAVFQVGGEVPVPQAFEPALGTGQTLGVFSSVEFRPFGVQLGVRPLVGDDDTVTLDVIPEVVTPDPGLTLMLRGTTGSDVATTAFETRLLRTSSRLQDGQSLVIGGLVNRTSTFDVSKTPGIGDVPLVGELFRDSSSNEEELELVIVIEPVILRDPRTDARLWEFPRGRELLRSAGVLPPAGAPGREDESSSPSEGARGGPGKAR